MIWSLVILKAAALAASISIDAFAASFAYGCQKIKIPTLSLHIINLICTFIMGISFLFGSIMLQYIPGQFALGLSFTILFLIGTAKLFDSITKSIIRKHSKLSKEIHLSIFNFKLLMRLYADPEAADMDVSKSLSPREAVVLAVSLSLDGFAVGFGAAMIEMNGWAVVLCSLVTNFIALLLGSRLGNKAAHKINHNISWLAGAVLIGLALEKLL